jgi:transketolase
MAASMDSTELDRKCINTIRFLAVDAVEAAQSGHPGMPMAMAPLGYLLFARFMRHNPGNPEWFNRDRFVLSAGHGSMLLYALLHLSGYDLSLDDLRSFRSYGSRTPGHPERGITPGVEVTTGPLGQGFGNAVGMAIAEAHLAARYNRPGFEIIDHRTYVLASDGDLMEGVASEAASLAGHLRLGKLICIYDDNRVSLSASTDLAFTEDRAARFAAYGWQTLTVVNGENLRDMENALRAAQDESTRPSLILLRSHIGQGAPHKHDTFESHGSPLGRDETLASKQAAGWPLDPTFYVPDQVRAHFHTVIERGRVQESAWSQNYDEYQRAYPEMAAELERLMKHGLPQGWREALPAIAAGAHPEATRTALGHTMNATAARLPELFGGDADLAPSTFTALKGLGDFQSPQFAPLDGQGSVGGVWGYAGRNLHFGVREHAMGAIVNGVAAHGGLLPFGSTFLLFSDYMRPPIRLASIMKLHVIFIFTHDSIGLGEDGPTHQPVEQLLSLRAIPELLVIRPASANEVVGAWQVAVEHQAGPVALILSRQKLPVLDPGQYPNMVDGVAHGGYVLAPVKGKPDILLVATGSEVHLALSARQALEARGIKAQVISMPCWELFETQSPQYRESVWPPAIPSLSIEAGLTLGWRRYGQPAMNNIGVDRFGASAPGEAVMREYGLNVEQVCERAQQILSK